MKIMIVDDSKVARTVLKKVLREAGHNDIVEAENGADGLKKIKSEKCDLVICDWHMPTMDGLAFVREIRASKGAGVPIVVVSSESSISRIIEVMNAGAQGYVRKPFSARDLQSKINEVEKKSQLAKQYVKSAVLSGSLSEIGFPALVQFLNASSMSGRLDLTVSGQPAEIHFRDGEVQTSFVGDFHGDDAFFEIAKHGSGRFRFRPQNNPMKCAMSRKTLPLLMDALRLGDELDTPE